MIPRIRFDIGWRDLAYGLLCSARRHDPTREAHRLESAWGIGDALACLSVRSGFDLLLQALSLPRGSEVLTSAVTIPHMIEILAHHGLVAVPIDLDLERMALCTPSVTDPIVAALTSRTRAILIAHLFGARIDMAPIVEVAHAHKLLVIEDCAQAFDGPDYRGHPDSDVALFSFGPIKHHTALGGALLRVRSSTLLAAMQRLHAGYSVQPRAGYARRLAKYCGLKLLSTTPAYTALVWSCRLARVDHDAFIGSFARGFAAGDLLTAIRHRPSAALTMLLRRRLATFDALRHQRRIRHQHAFATQIAPVFRFGQLAAHQTFWLFPVCVPDPALFTAALRRAGFDATRSQSALCVVAPRPGRPAATVAAGKLAGIVYLPVDPRTPARAQQRLVRAIRKASA